MTLSGDLSRMSTVFIDTAPIIYFIEAHPQMGPLAKELITIAQSGNVIAFSSVITITEVLSKPFESGDVNLAKKFAEFLTCGKNLTIIEISESIAEAAAKLRGHYPSLKTIDALQVSTSMNLGADAFITNDKKLKQIKEIKVLLLSDYL